MEHEDGRQPRFGFLRRVGRGARTTLDGLDLSDAVVAVVRLVAKALDALR